MADIYGHKEQNPHGNMPWTFLWPGLRPDCDHLLSICLWRVQRSSPSLQNCWTHSQDHHHKSLEKSKIILRWRKVNYSITFKLILTQFENRHKYSPILHQNIIGMALGSIPSRIPVPIRELTRTAFIVYISISNLLFWEPSISVFC